MKKIRKTLGMLIALLLMNLVTPIIFIYKIVIKIFSKEESLFKYLYLLSVSRSQYFAAFTFETEDWTTSSNSYIKEFGSFKVAALRIFIDFLLGEGHCKNSYMNEKKEIKTEGEQL